MNAGTPKRVVVTGGAGFIGRAIVGLLAARGDQVVALVRDPDRAQFLKHDRVTLQASDLSSVAQLAAQMRGADAMLHGAGSYRVGIKRSEHQRMWDANVGATERVLDAAISAGIPRIVYISTVNVFGDTHGVAVDESYRRDLAEGFVSYYDETKFRAHEAAEKRIADGAPIVIVQPAQVYGPNDHSLASAQLEQAHAGKLRYLALANAGMAWVHVDDLATGIIAALDRGRIGEKYVFAGDCLRMGESIGVAARVGGRKPPKLTLPTGLLKLMAPINDGLGGLPGMPDNLAETISSGDGVTYWARHDKATQELGFEPRSLEQGVTDTWGSKGSPRRT
ncbi:MAG TPA: NAD-dependent epimerase/dehydratase family protein [Candidatus Limnocylindrales bacterium]|nr:NAD-dependent epimerase/dehydratase family protein [Candidatus Limnocylindrales bacterium]